MRSGAPLGPSDIPVVYRDEHLLVLNKPVGIATTAPDGGPSLFALAQRIDPRAPQLHPLSRLDTQVSGMVTFARTARCNQLAMESRKTGALRRRYLGITLRVVPAEEGTWRFSIAIDPRDPKKRRALGEGVEGEGIKLAHTNFRVRATAGPLTALDLFPVTGRTHQLRVHASAAGCPLAGDVAYGGEKRLVLPNGRVLTAGRVMLHCAAFCMPNPDKPSTTIELTLAPASDMQAFWKSAGGDPTALEAAQT